ncbi:hypothetical protein [Micromonospora wenchangensis]|uniref:hypothetical protein n=1 Tax=Micromonospora wenchangensis TaxID=1185415 RepID=UPI00382FA704
MTLPLLPGAPEPLRCANPFCRKVLKHPGPGGYGPECARRYGLTTPAMPRPRAEPQVGPDLFDAASEPTGDQP